MEPKKGERKCECGNIATHTTTKYGKRWSCKACGGVAWGDGTFADKELRLLRNAAHAAFDAWWQNSGIKRKVAYKMLAGALGIKESKVHMRYMNKEQCKTVAKIYGSTKTGEGGK
jgi:hypothetical protein